MLEETVCFDDISVVWSQSLPLEIVPGSLPVPNPLKPKSKISGSSKKLLPSIVKLYCFHFGLRFSGEPAFGL